jgi:tRNA (cmo5U34)-methyltransferase
MTEPRVPRYRGPDTAGRTDKMSKNEIRLRFDREQASCYSQQEPAWLPEFSHAFDLIPRLVAPFVRDGDEVTDVGAGTGNLSRKVLGAIPGIHVTLIDFSANMLAEVPNVLAAFPGRFRTETADFMEYDYGNARVAAVISSFAIHHCRGEGQYLDLYRRIGRGLTRPGVFACCDVVAGDTPGLSELNEQGWREFLQSREFSGEDIERILSNYHVEDSPLSVRAHLALLRRAGFGAADVVWKKANFAVYVGVVA